MIAANGLPLGEVLGLTFDGVTVLPPCTLTGRYPMLIVKSSGADAFLLFLQFAPAGIVPTLLKKSQDWKAATEAKTAAQA